MEKKKRVLWLEDDNDDHSKIITEKIFTSFNMEIDWAETGIEAHQKLLKYYYDGIILDLMLEPGTQELRPNGPYPYMGGVKVLEIIKDMQKKVWSRNVAVMVVSAVTVGEIIEQVHKFLGDIANECFLGKPVTPSDIATTLYSLMEKS